VAKQVSVGGGGKVIRYTRALRKKGTVRACVPNEIRGDWGLAPTGEEESLLTSADGIHFSVRGLEEQVRRGSNWCEKQNSVLPSESTNKSKGGLSPPRTENSPFGKGTSKKGKTL